MNDIGLFVIDGCIQLKIENGDLAGDEGLETAAMISLFTDKRVTNGELSEGYESKRGWWGDIYPVVDGDLIGSKLWLVDRGKINNSTLASLETYATEALQWMIEDGVAASVSASAEFNENLHAILTIELTRPTGEQDRFAVNWQKQEILR